ncbi:hypothetical protein A4X06_0g6351 [Tilletia controversa]|uniref:Uncharacterized protein n=1 Tax=Tilletia controversa TaxID=13291 RepID=A0A8X7SV26_9BASI|nr:hypothetical protein CF328_g6359 [Tilletia controversa]KAE8243391.1 hypothetical protein A4X06_0g6351 [Tilletia controversa]
MLMTLIFYLLTLPAQPGRMSNRDGDHDLLRTIGEQAALKYNTVPDVTLLDTEERAYWKIGWHLVHELPASTLWEVVSFFRQYISPTTKKIGFTLVLES